MKKTIFGTMIVLFMLTMFMTGCGNKVKPNDTMIDSTQIEKVDTIDSTNVIIDSIK